MLYTKCAFAKAVESHSIKNDYVEAKLIFMDDMN
jgi:hypothetical protein